MMRPPVLLVALLVVVPLASAPVAGLGSGAGAAPAEPAAAVAPAAGPVHVASTLPAAPSDQEDPDADDTVTRIAVHADGSATWTVEIRTQLRTEGDVEAYRAFQREFRENTSAFLDPFAERMRGVVATAANETGRAMTATGFAAETAVQEVPRRWGVVSLTFEWTNFAVADGDALVVGDVFGGGLFLAENDSLVVEAPEGYRVANAAPEPAALGETAATWEGRMDFADRRPRVRLEPAATGPGEGPGGGPPAAVIAAAVGLAAMAGGALLYRRRGGGSDGDGSPRRARPDDPGERPGGAAVRTDEERVVALLAENGGRMRQAAVAEATGWSASKTSRVLADMVEAGTVEKLQLGRENLIDLVDEESG